MMNSVPLGSFCNEKSNILLNATTYSATVGIRMSSSSHVSTTEAVFCVCARVCCACGLLAEQLERYTMAAIVAVML